MSFVWMTGGVPEPHVPAAPASRVEPVSSAAPAAPVSGKPTRSFVEAYAKADRTLRNGIGKIMTSPVVTVSPSESARAALELIRRRKFRHLPVVQDGTLVGILSDRDLMSADPEKRVSGLMSTRVLTATEDTEIREAARIMSERRIDSLPVLAADGRLAGIVTSTDLLRWIVLNTPLDLWI